MAVIAAMAFFSTILWMVAILWLAPGPNGGMIGSVFAHLPAGSGIRFVQETPSPSSPTGPTSTPLPPEYLTNRNQTVGITLAGALLVLIVVIGVLVFLPKKNDNSDIG